MRVSAVPVFRKLVVIVCCLLCAAHSTAAANLRFKQISVSEGLSQSTVLDITQDKLGFLWIATSDGLNKYDGYEFIIYRNNPSDITTLGSNTVFSLLEDREGILWIGTSTGLSRYNPRTEDFSNFEFKGKSIQVFDIKQIDATTLLVAADVGLLVFNKETAGMELKSYIEGIREKFVCSYKDDFLVGTSKGAYLYSVKGETLSPVLDRLADQDISDIIYSEGQGCWVSTFGGGLYRTDDRLRITERYWSGGGLGKQLDSDYIRVLKPDGEGRLWIGTFEGLTLLDIASGTIRSHRHSSDDDTSLSHNSIRSIFIDSQQGIWLGTYYGGLSYTHPIVFRFGHMRHMFSRNSLSDNTISCIVEDGKNENLWIGTNDNGLNYYDASTDTFTQFSVKGSSGLMSNNIKCILPDRSGKIYIGTHAGGLSCLDMRTKAIETYVIDRDVPAFNSCYCLLDDGSDQMWVGTLNGLFSFNKRTRTFMPHALTKAAPRLKNTDINYLFRDSRDRVWICTNRGLYTYSIKTGTLSNYEIIRTDKGAAVQNSDLFWAMEDSRSDIWLCSDKGLFKYLEATNTFANYTTADGLPNNYTYGIQEDVLGRLWISTNDGLSCFAPSDTTFRNYSQQDGMSNKQFNRYSSCKTSGGQLYFGGINGITCFDPANLSDNPYSPQPMVTGISVFNKDAMQSKDITIEKDELGHNIGISLSSKYNVLSIRYVSINPIASGNNTFSYMLRGFDSEWYQTSNRSVSYSNLKPGRYEFLLRSSNNDSIWSEQITTFYVHVTPRWYQTTMAKIGYVLLALAIVFIVIRFYIERVERKRTEEMSQEKIRFYVNLSHELRTPLTLIISPLDELKGYKPEDKYLGVRIAMIRRNTTRLLHMVNQLLDYRKAESGILKIQVAEEKLSDIVSGVVSMFEDAAVRRDIDFNFEAGLKTDTYPVDKHFIERIIMNLLSNAFKFTRDSGEIKVSVKDDGDNIVLKVSDNGQGISDEEKGRIFDRFYKVDESRPGTGIGLSIVKRLVELHHGVITLESHPDVKTEFTICLPRDSSGYSSDEISKSEARKERQKLDPTLYLEESGNLFEGSVSEDGEDEKSQETMLIVEDNAEIKHYLAESFSGRFKIITAANGQQALALLKESTPDIILTDLMMPIMDGQKFVQHIKQNIKTSHIPVIIITAKDNDQDRMAGLEAGADDYVAKPFSLPVLNAKINNLLKSKYRLLKHYHNNAEIEPEKIVLNPLDGEFLRKATKIVEENMANVDFSANDFSDRMCMSRSSLHIKMKSITGESTINFIRSIRLNHAGKLLEEGQYTILEISEMTGFSTPSYFATIFKKYIGYMPTEYAKMKQNRRAGGGNEKNAE